MWAYLSFRLQTQNSLAMRLFPLLTLVLLMATPELRAQNVQKPEVVVFTTDMNEVALDNLRKYLSQFDIALHFQELKFAPAGGLLSINFTVKDGGGHSYEAGTEDLANAGLFGFEFSIVDGKSTLLKVGSLKAKPE